MSINSLGNKLAPLLASRRANFGLPAELYLSPETYRLDIDHVLDRHWQCVDHVSAIPNSGDYLVFEYDRDSAIIVRGEDGVVRAFANICRHRGSRICDKSGKAEGGFVCPYHAWAYNLDGSLANARMMPATFDKNPYGLKSVALRLVQGLIFVCFSANPLAFDDCEDNLNAVLGPYDWEGAKVVHHESFTFTANWKLALENQVECYHCAPAHPEFTVVHGQSTKHEAKLATEMKARTEGQGIFIPLRDHWGLDALPDQEQAYSNRYPMKGCTASRDGQPLAPLMGKFKSYEQGMSATYAGPLNHLLSYTDYGAVFRYTPRSHDRTELAVFWLVRGDAVEGRDYNLEELTWLWRVTAAADKKIVQDNQLGISSKYYQPGPYALPVEQKTVNFTNWYIHALGHALTTAS